MSNLYNGGTAVYKQVKEGIYECIDDGEIMYVTSLSFVQEPEYEEGEFADNISQYSLEDILLIRIKLYLKMEES